MLTEPDYQLHSQSDDKGLFKTEEDKREWKRERDIALEELDGVLTSAYPSTGASDKKARGDILLEVFGTFSKTAIEQFSSEAIRAGIAKIKDKLIADGTLKSMLKVESQ